MASIQSNINSAFNALLIAGLGGSRAIKDSKAYQIHKEKGELAASLENSYQSYYQTMEEYAEEAESGLDAGEMNAAQEQINKRALEHQSRLERMVQLDPSAENVRELHDFSRGSGSIAIEKQKQRIAEIKKARQTIADREEILSYTEDE